VLRAAGYDFDHCDLGSVAQAKADQVRSKVALRFVGASARNARIVVSAATSYGKLRAGRTIVRTKTSQVQIPTRNIRFLRLVERAIPKLAA
jgi:hypothetical protein